MGDARTTTGTTSVAGPEPAKVSNGYAYELPHLQSDFISKAYQLPMVSQSYGYITTIYGWGKDHNALLRGVLERLEKSVVISLVVANEVATRTGIADRLSGPFHFADESACRVLDHIEHVLPVITTIEPQKLVDGTLQRVQAYRQGVSERYEGAKLASHEKVEGVKHMASEKVQHVLETPTAGAVNKTVARGLKSAEGLIDTYLPADDNDENEKIEKPAAAVTDSTTIGMPNGSVGNGHFNGDASQYYDSSDGFRHTYGLACTIASKLGHRVNVRAQRQQQRMKYLLIEMPASTLHALLEQLARNGYSIRQRVSDYVVEGSELLAPKVQFVARPVRSGLEKATTVVWTHVPPEAVERVRRVSEAAQSFIGVRFKRGSSYELINNNNRCQFSRTAGT